MVGHAGLREIVGAYPLGAVSGADLYAAFLGYGAVAGFQLRFVELAVQLLHRLFLVLELGTLLLALYNCPGRLVDYSYRGFRLVDMLTSRAA